jgi:hypothetical protein
VALDVLRSVLHVAQSFGSILNEQLLDQILGDGIHVSGPFNFTGQDLLVDAERVVVEKWRVTGQHLVDQDPCSRQKRKCFNVRTARNVAAFKCQFQSFFLPRSCRSVSHGVNHALPSRRVTLTIDQFRSFFGKQILAFSPQFNGARPTRPC